MKIRCNKCYWKGEEEGLRQFTDDAGYFLGCPNCETDNYLMDIDDKVSETRIYAIELELGTDPNLFNDEQFIYEAEKQGLVWSLNGFAESFNSGCVSDEWYIRIITK